MRKSSPWIRSYRDALHNPKILTLSDRLFRMWQCCLWISDDDGKLPKVRDIGLHLRVTATEAEQIICDLIEAELIDVSNPGTPQRALAMHDWKSYQYTDHSTERVRKFRNKNKVQDADKPKHNETRSIPFQKQPDLDSETDTEKESSGLTAGEDAAKGKTGSFNSGLGGKDWNEGERFDAVVNQGVRFDIPVGDLRKKIPRGSNAAPIKSRAAYLHSMCVQNLQTRFPTIAERTLKAAMWGNRAAAESVAKAMWGAMA